MFSGTFHNRILTLWRNTVNAQKNHIFLPPEIISKQATFFLYHKATFTNFRVTSLLACHLNLRNINKQSW